MKWVACFKHGKVKTKLTILLICDNLIEGRVAVNAFVFTAFLRGANWNNTSNAGVFALNLNNTPTNQNNNIGFRCASDEARPTDG
jgi:hypothetical protein